MTPRRLLPYLLIFLVLAGAYAGLRWRQEAQNAKQEQAKKVFQVKETEISGFSLSRGAAEIRLAKQDKVWYLTSPLHAKADQTVVDNLLVTLARLRMERDLGAEKDLKTFGLDKPALVVKFTAQGQPHQLAVGANVPGDQAYYALRDQDPHLLMISGGSKDSLDRQLLALRDKTLLGFILSEVKGLRIKAGNTAVDLEKTGPRTWLWVGRPDVKVRGDRVEKLLREIHLARIKDFVTGPPPKNQALGLAPGKRLEITVVTAAGNHILFLGSKKDDAVYARQGADGPVVLVDATLPEAVTKTLDSLEDRRLWSGAIPEVSRVAWGPPGQLWTARKDKDFWKLTGPGQAATEVPAVRLEMALWNFQKLEGAPLKAPAAAPGGAPAFVLEFFNQADKPVFHLEEIGAVGQSTLKLLTRTGETPVIALTPQTAFRQWQEEMTRLTVSAKKPGKASGKSQAAPGGKP
ncbi:MAG: DUF4340 domain-containing protein [Desulfobaccales bacterium]